jgi:hypothetical protein
LCVGEIVESALGPGGSKHVLAAHLKGVVDVAAGVNVGGEVLGVVCGGDGGVFGGLGVNEGCGVLRMFDPCRGRGGFGAAFPPLKRGARIVKPLPGLFAGRSGCMKMVVWVS